MSRMTRVPFRITPRSRGATVINQALITWVRGSESALGLDGMEAEAAFCIKTTITQGIGEPSHAEYPSR